MRVLNFSHIEQEEPYEEEVERGIPTKALYVAIAVLVVVNLAIGGLIFMQYKNQDSVPEKPAKVKVIHEPVPSTPGTPAKPIHPGSSAKPGTVNTDKEEPTPTETATATPSPQPTEKTQEQRIAEEQDKLKVTTPAPNEKTAEQKAAEEAARQADAKKEAEKQAEIRGDKSDVNWDDPKYKDALSQSGTAPSGAEFTYKERP